MQLLRDCAQFRKPSPPLPDESKIDDIIKSQHLERGRTVVDTIKWVRENGCVLEKSCPYVGSFNQAAKECNVRTLIFSFHSVQTNFFISLLFLHFF